MNLAPIRRYFSRAREAGPKSILEIAGSRLSGYMRYPSDALNRGRIRRSPPPQFDQAAQRHSAQTEPRLLVLWDAYELRRLRLRMSEGGDHAAIGSRAIQRANRVLGGNLSFLGWGAIRFTEAPVWNADLYRNVEWPDVFHKRIDIKRAGVNCDVKVPWEISRLQFLPWLGQAWLVSAKLEYVRGFWNLIRDWSIRNPVGYGVNWTCSMEVAIRAVNILVSANLLANGLTATESAWIRKLLLDHYHHIRFNLELSDVRGNHYLFDALGLAVLSVAIFGADAKRTRKHLNRFVEETIEQFHVDGVHIEHASGYQRMVTEALLLISLVCRRHDLDVSDEFRARFKRAIDILDCLSLANGIMPLIGDSDSGNILILGDARGNDLHPLLSCSGIFAGRPHQCRTDRMHEEAAWLFGGAPAEYPVPRQLQPTVFDDSQKAALYSFPMGGYFVMRHGQSVITIRGGKSGLGGRGSHDHNDQLSLCISAFGQPLLVDSGTSNYTADLSGHERDLATERHNTVTINALEQSPIVSGSVTCTVRSATATVLNFASTELGGAVWEGVIKEYGGAGVGLSHSRRVEISTMNDREIALTVFDHARSSLAEALSCTATWIVSPMVSVEVTGPGSMLLSDNVAAIRLKILTNATTCKILVDAISPEYGMRIPAARLVFAFQGQGEAYLATRMLFRLGDGTFGA